MAQFALNLLSSSSHMHCYVMQYSVNATRDGSEAILQLAGGDLRRVLNLLQSTHMAYPEVNEETVYLTAGAAIPKVIAAILNSLLTQSFQSAYQHLLQVLMDDKPID
jgi:replication factor C subunit 3/5